MTPKHKLFLLAAFMDEHDIQIYIDAFGLQNYPDLYIAVGENNSIEIGSEIYESTEFLAADIIEHAKAME